MSLAVGPSLVNVIFGIFSLKAPAQYFSFFLKVLFDYSMSGPGWALGRPGPGPAWPWAGRPLLVSRAWSIWILVA